jgi:hypothetical protein
MRPQEQEPPDYYDEPPPPNDEPRDPEWSDEPKPQTLKKGARIRVLLDQFDYCGSHYEP